MRRKVGLPELLAPAGDMSSLVAAVKGGADAVYVGCKSFSARAFAKNFDIEELKVAARYCHLHGVRLYVTVNTLLSDKEVPEATALASELYAIGIDALIIADVGLMQAIRRSGNPIELHASTQLSVHNVAGADEAAKMGCSRVVVARELSEENIRTVTEGCVPEVEVFIHGALCVCHSGQCLFSSMIGGRSGNRGECAQPCRLPYNGGYPLSLRDLSYAKHIPKLIESGVASLKIEGRMKSPGYVYTVTSIYRRLLDECRPSNRREDEILSRAFSRSGFTDGYFTGKLDNMTGIRSQEDKESTAYIANEEFTFDKTPVKAKVTMHLGEPAVITLAPKKCGRAELHAVTVYGEVCQPAISRPLDPPSIKERVAKMGQTLLSLDKDDVICEIDESINLPISAINALRRAAAEEFECQNTGQKGGSFEYKSPNVNNSGQNNKQLRTAMVYNPARLSCMRDFFDVVFVPSWKIDECDAAPSGVALPPVVMDDETEEVREHLWRAKKRGVKYALVGNIGGISLACEAGLIPVADHRMNVTNKDACLYWDARFSGGIILSCELTLPAVRDIGGGTVVFGRLPLMITERCFMKDNGGCASCSRVSLTDRKGEKFPMIREFDHRTLILNSQITYMGDKRSELDRCRISHRHFIFTTEGSAEVTAALRAYKQGAPLSGGVRRVSQNNLSRKKTAKRK